MSPLAAWWLAIRPRTLTASIAPVLVGTALAAREGAFDPLRAGAALAGALLIQVGTNLSNDVLDFRRGADSAARLGPTRAVQAGLLPARQVALAAAIAFVLAGAVGVYLVAEGGGRLILLLGVAALLSGILYTAGPAPLAYVGLGDAFVMVFFGLAAVAGTAYVQTGRVDATALGLGIAVGALAVAILAVNNLRDIETDATAGKRTLAVRLGPAATRAYYAGLVAVAFAVPVAMWLAGRLGPGALVSLGALPLAVAPVRQVTGGLAGAGLNRVLAETARLQLAHALLLALGLMW